MNGPVQSRTADRCEAFVLRAELGIHEADLAWQRALEDGDVTDALVWMRDELAGGRGLPFSTLDAVQQGLTLVTGGGTKPGTLIVTRVLTHWRAEFADRGRLSDVELLRVVHEVEQSCEALSRGPASRGYLAYLAERLRREGLSVDLLDAEGLSVSAQGTSPDDLPLDQLAEQWLARPEEDDLLDALVHRVALRAAEGETAALLGWLSSLLPAAEGRHERATLLWLEGWLRQQVGDAGGAMAALSRAVEADDRHVVALRTLGLACLEQGDAENAILDLERVLEIEADDEWSYEMLLGLYVQAGNVRAEIDLLERWARAVPQRLFARYALAQAWQRTGRVWRARWLRARTWLRHPSDVTPFIDWAAWARFQIERGSARKVIRRLERIWGSDPELAWWTPWLHAVALHALGARDGAQRLLLELEPDPADCALICGQARRVWGEVMDDQPLFWEALGCASREPPGGASLAE